MAAMVPFAAKGAQGASQVASKALTGDIYVRKRTRIVGKGKKAHVVEDELRVNPVSVGVGVAATALGLGLAAWLLQLRLQPTTVQEMATVVDVPAWVETIHHDGAGHWEQNVSYGPAVKVWMPPMNTKGTIKPGHWATVTTTTPIPGQHWIDDVMPWDETMSHPAVTHQEPTGKMVKRFPIEQRRGTSFKDVLDDLSPVGPGQRFWGNWGHGRVFGPWLGRK